MNKFLFSDVKKYFNDSGYELVTGESEYKNSESRIEYVCPKHGVITTTFASFKRGYRCKKCAADKIKVPYGRVKTEIESLGYKLLSNDYVDNKTKLLCLCPKHGEFKKKYNSIQQGQGCPKCGRERIGEKQKLSYDFIKSEFEKRGYTLVSKEYIGSNSKLDYVCRKHKDKGIQSITYNSIQQGQGCYFCGRESISKKLLLDFNNVRKLFKSKGYKLISGEDEYIDSHSNNLRYVCPKHPDVIQTASYSNFNQGCGCPLCAIENNRGAGSAVWKGGVTPLLRYLRPMLNPWVQQQLQRTNYTCEITGKQGTLNVHHMVSFKKIFKMTMKELHMDIRENIGDYSEDELQLITVNLMKNNDLYASPIVMLQSVHQKFHQFCGGNRKPTSFEQLAEFKRLVKEGVISA